MIVLGNRISEYDIQTLNEARRLLIDVYNFNYGFQTRFDKRLTTIINKLDELIALSKESN